MRIGILGGTGPAGAALAARLSSVGHFVTIGSREAARAVEVCAAQVARFDELADHLEGSDNAAAAACDIVVVATPWEAAAVVAAQHADELSGKVVISMANALVRVGREFQPLVPPRGSVAAHVQAEVPNSLVVGAFHHIPATELGDVHHPIESDVLICSDSVEAIATVSELVAQIPGCRPLDAGELSNAMAIEAFTAVLLQLNVRYRTRVAPKMTGIDT